MLVLGSDGFMRWCSGVFSLFFWVHHRWKWHVSDFGVGNEADYDCRRCIDERRTGSVDARYAHLICISPVAQHACALEIFDGNVIFKISPSTYGQFPSRDPGLKRVHKLRCRLCRITERTLSGTLPIGIMAKTFPL